MLHCSISVGCSKQGQPRWHDGGGYASLLSGGERTFDVAVERRAVSARITFAPSQDAAVPANEDIVRSSRFRIVERHGSRFLIEQDGKSKTHLHHLGPDLRDRVRPVDGDTQNDEPIRAVSSIELFQVRQSGETRLAERRPKVDEDDVLTEMIGEPNHPAAELGQLEIGRARSTLAWMAPSPLAPFRPYSQQNVVIRRAGMRRAWPPQSGDPWRGCADAMGSPSTLLFELTKRSTPFVVASFKNDTRGRWLRGPFEPEINLDYQRNDRDFWRSRS